jgi:hypothetical protein
LQSSQFELTVIDGERATGKTNGTFYESIVTDDQFSSRRWSLNNTGRELSLKLLTGNVFLCEVVVQTYPSEWEIKKRDVHNFLVKLFRGMWPSGNTGQRTRPC